MLWLLEWLSFDVVVDLLFFALEGIVAAVEFLVYFLTAGLVTRRVVVDERALRNFSSSQEARLAVRVRARLRDQRQSVSPAPAAVRQAARTEIAMLRRTSAGTIDPGIRTGAVSLHATGALCPVCGTALNESRIACSHCATPHHRECWSYNDGCATYGCAGRR